MQRHPIIGKTLVSSDPSVTEESRRIIVEHHERSDGTGYPYGLRRSLISPLSEIVGISDCFEGLLGFRRDRPSMPAPFAVRELYCQSTAGRFTGSTVQRFVRLVGVYPVGSFVELTTGERGIVLTTNLMDTVKPLVRLIFNNCGMAYDPPLKVDLRKAENDSCLRTIHRVLDPVSEGVDISQYVNDLSYG